MSEVKILPCPFCGGEAVKMAFSWGNICDEYTVKCTECGVGTKVLKSDEAVRAWNTRKPMDDIVERLEEELKLADEEKERCSRENHLMFDSAKSYATGISNAIEIVKGGVED